jgi:methylmalonyl-CoA carboxyltransferase large subunit
MPKPTITTLNAEIESLRAQVADLGRKLARLEAAFPEEPPFEEAQEEPIPEHILLAISAAVAAFLGERARVRHVRLVSSRSWAQQGRVSIQASHSLH